MHSEEHRSGIFVYYEPPGHTSYREQLPEPAGALAQRYRRGPKQQKHKI